MKKALFSVTPIKSNTEGKNIRLDTHAVFIDSSFQLVKILYRINGLFHGLTELPTSVSSKNYHPFGGFLNSNKEKFI